MLELPRREAVSTTVPDGEQVPRVAVPGIGTCGPITLETPGGKRLFLLVVDDRSRFMWLILLASKDQTAGAIKQLQARLEVESGERLGTLRTDRGGEFTARAFLEFCADQGIQCHLTAPYTPQQNGVVERRNQTVLGMARSMMKGMQVPGWLWGEAVSTAVFVLNRSPTRSVEGKTPYEVWYGSKPAVHFFRTFGCVAHVKVAGGHQKKLEDRSTPMVFIGYEPGSKAYRFLNPSTGRVLISRDAVFDEGRAWNWDDAPTSTANNNSGEPFTVEYMTTFIRAVEACRRRSESHHHHQGRRCLLRLEFSALLQARRLEGQ